MDEEVRILCVDDEKNVLKALTRLFLDDDYEIITATSGDEGLDTLKNVSPIQIVISDYRMPGMNGVDFLKEVCREWPDTVRIVLSGYADAGAVVAAINEGQIYKFIPKPWNDDELKVTISNSIERYFLRKRNRELSNKLKKKNEELQKINDNLELLVCERTSELKFQNEVLTRAQSILDRLPVAVLGLDLDGMIVQCNQKGIEWFGRSERKMIGLKEKAVFPEDITAFLKKVVENKKSSAQILIGSIEFKVTGILMDQHDGQEGVILVFDKKKKND